MMPNKILTEYFWEFQSVIELWDVVNTLFLSHGIMKNLCSLHELIWRSMGLGKISQTFHVHINFQYFFTCLFDRCHLNSESGP